MDKYLDPKRVASLEKHTNSTRDPSWDGILAADTITKKKGSSGSVAATNGHVKSPMISKCDNLAGQMLTGRALDPPDEKSGKTGGGNGDFKNGGSGEK
jgi:hypothetical protein